MSQTWCHLAGGKTYEDGASAPAGKARCSSPRREKCRGISHWCFPLANLARAICHRSLGLVASYTTERQKWLKKDCQQAGKYPQAQQYEKGSQLIFCVAGVKGIVC